MRMCRQAIDTILSTASDRRAPHEAWMLNVLARSPKDYLGALQKVPRNTRLLYLHAYQSWIWNRALSERIKRFGLTPAVGDLVPLAEVDKEELDEDESDDEDQSNENKKQEKSSSEKDAKTEPEGQKEQEKEKDTEKEKEKEKEQKRLNNDTPRPKLPVKVLTQEDVDSGVHSIFDIVMPLPGHNIDYPPNMKEYYEELITKDGLTLELRHKIKVFSMSGAYRYICARPRDMSWQVVRYNDPHADLILSDADEIDGRTDTGIVEDGKYKALLLTMSLPASCYATMALRELLKVDTSGDNQALKNNYYKRKREDSKTEDANDAADKGSDKNGEEKSEQDNSEKEMAVDETAEGKETENSEVKDADSECTEAKKAKTDDSGQ
ncbi:hypothetical protein evm_008046 [Chilo suppressalis]|nr:hypothetical protein evm_008046 [Chilo suppressalis]